MAGERIVINGTVCFIDYADGEGRATIDGKVWRWEFHEFCGPLWLRQDGEPRKNQCPTNKKVWSAFEAWHVKWLKSKTPARRKRKELAIK